MERIKFFLMIFTIENLNIQVLIWDYFLFILIKRIAFQQLQVDSVMSLIALHLNLRFLESILVR